MNFFNWLISEWLGNVFNSFRLFADWLAKPFTDPWQTAKKLWKPKVASGFRSAFLFLLMVAVIVGLGALTAYLGWDRYVRADRPAWFRKYWMGWVALLVFIIIRVGIAILRMLRVLSPSFSRFSDIDAAISRGIEAAEAAGIAISQVPVFLVVGLSRMAEQEFCASGSVGKDVCVDDDRLPLHWYGNEKALWITLPGASVTSLQADLLTEAQNSAVVAEVPDEELVGAAVGAGAGTDTERTISMGAFLASEVAASANAPMRMRETTVEIPTIPAKRHQRARERLGYLCHALQQLRHPVCTVNGVLLHVPFNDRVVPEKVSQQFRDCVKTDMTALQADIGVRCLSAVVFTGCQDNPAFKSYIQSLPPQSLVHRCGVSFPQLVELGDDDPERIHAWLHRDFELQAMQLYKSRAGLPINEDIFRFVDLIRQSRTYVTSILRSAFLQPAVAPFCFAGIYFTELSDAGAVPHPFLQGVLAKFLREHDEVISWTPQMLAQDRRQRRTARILLFLGALFMFLNVYLFYSLVPK